MARVDLMELGETGLQKSGGQIYEEFLRELRGDRWLKVVREMSEQDSVVVAFLFAIEMLLRQTEWEIEPGDNDTETAEFIESCFDDMSLTWEDTLSEILTMLPYGYSYMELVYKRRGGDSTDATKRSKYTDGRIGWRKWAIRSQHTRWMWDFDDNGGIRGMWQTQERGAPVLIPIEKALLFRTTTHLGNPEGRSILRGGYRSWYFKKHMENIEGIGVERDLAGLPVALVPPELLAPNASAANQALFAAIKEIVTNIRRDEQEGVVWPLAYDDNGRELFKLQLLSTGGARQFDIGSIVNRKNNEIAMAVLADFILLGHEAVGSYSLSATKSSMFKTALKAWLDSIADVINTYAIPRLLNVNGMKPAAPPKLVFGDVGEVEIADLMSFVRETSAAGMTLFPSVEVVNNLRGKMRLPLLTEDEIARRESEAKQAEALRRRLLQSPPVTDDESDIDPAGDNASADGDQGRFGDAVLAQIRTAQQQVGQALRLFGGNDHAN